MLFFYIAILLVIFLVYSSVFVITARENGIVERLGRFSQTLKPGLHFLVPFVDRLAYRHDIREQVFEVPPQMCISKDNIQIEVDGIIYLQVLDSKLASYGIENYRSSSVNLAQTNMRSELGKLTLHQTFSERDSLNATIVEEIDKASTAWGIKVLRYEIMNIKPSEGVVHTLEKAMVAERDRRAEVTLATAEKDARSLSSEGTKQEAINVSEGQMEKRINEADGQAQEIRILAEATAFGISRISAAIARPGGESAVQLRVLQKYYDQLGFILAKSKITVVPPQVASIKSFFEGFEKVTSSFSNVSNVPKG